MDINVKKERGLNLKLNVTVPKDTTEANVCHPFLDLFPALARIKLSKGALHISVKKHYLSKGKIIKVSIRCDKLAFSEELTCKVYFTDWICMGKLSYKDADFPDGRTQLLEVSMRAIDLKKITFPNLYCDMNFCDVLMTVEDGGWTGVVMHKACLCAHSPMLKSILLGEWKNITKLRLRIRGATMPTLVHLKDYIYLGYLPEGTMLLMQLLLFAKEYSFENLKTECIFKLANTVIPENMLALRQFAIDHEITELIDALMRMTSNEIIHRVYQIDE